MVVAEQDGVQLGTVDADGRQPCQDSRAGSPASTSSRQSPVRTYNAFPLLPLANRQTCTILRPSPGLPGQTNFLYHHQRKGFKVKMQLVISGGYDVLAVTSGS